MNTKRSSPTRMTDPQALETLAAVQKPACAFTKILATRLRQARAGHRKVHAGSVNRHGHYAQFLQPFASRLRR